MFPLAISSYNVVSYQNDNFGVSANFGTNLLILKITLIPKKNVNPQLGPLTWNNFNNHIPLPLILNTPKSPCSE